MLIFSALLADLTLPLVDEKADLPAIIVTPSSPIGEKDFAIAFLAPKPQPTMRERASNMLPSIPKIPTVFHRRLPSEIKLPVTPLHADYEAPTPSFWSPKGRACTSILLAVLVVIMGCHLLLHSLAVYHPRLEYSSVAFSGQDTVLATVNLDPTVISHTSVDDAETPALGGWFNLHALWAPAPNVDGKRSAHFIISEEEYNKIHVDAAR